MSDTITGKELMRRWAIGVPKLRTLLRDEGVDPTSTISWDTPKEVAGTSFYVSDVSELELRYSDLKTKAKEYEQKGSPSWWMPDDGVVGRQGAKNHNEAVIPVFNGFAEDEARRLRQNNESLKEEVASLKNKKNNLPSSERWKRSLSAAVKATALIIQGNMTNQKHEDVITILRKCYDYEEENMGVMTEAERLFWEALPPECKKQRGRPKK